MGRFSGENFAISLGSCLIFTTTHGLRSRREEGMVQGQKPSLSISLLDMVLFSPTTQIINDGDTIGGQEEGEQPTPPEGGKPNPPECKIPPKDKLAAEELRRDINNNFDEPISIAKICEEPSKTWFGKCLDTLKCDKQCIEWEGARHGACHERESKYMCFCYVSCDASDKRPPVPPDCPPVGPKKYVDGRLSS
ncbi:uncharacterized protein LOC112515704 [Cynara cardunculus var. scolymus]|uniref:Gamma thionin n=1 Tax=Cynara cardunculus var. scolymus TaxID=59895 RepID=A0A103XKK7_CYNCS|nr:uncharacterized protein LOC112515704 [Cynara cardunculus var. scolymus]KVH92462.1 Gamma thionin [Cynara cardunculus var. scolymus]